MTDLNALCSGVLSGQRRSIAQSITLSESTLSTDQELSRKLLDKLQSKSGQAVRLGISGIPGVGKSTFIENFGIYLLSQNPELKIGVLAVDPSSPLRGGSLLGDKTRMEELSSHPRAFIRPSPGGGDTGGVSRRCRESIQILDAAGYDLIFVETIGVGQAEYQVASMVDLFLMLQMPGTGDEIQGMKKGALELADLIIIHKADGDLKLAAQKTKQQQLFAMDLSSSDDDHTAPVLLISSTEKRGFKSLKDGIDKLIVKKKKSNEFELKRSLQKKQWFEQEIKYQLIERIRQRPDFEKVYQSQLDQVIKSKTYVGQSVSELLSLLEIQNQPSG